MIQEHDMFFSYSRLLLFLSGVFSVSHRGLGPTSFICLGVAFFFVIQFFFIINEGFFFFPSSASSGFFFFSILVVNEVY